MLKKASVLLAYGFPFYVISNVHYFQNEDVLKKCVQDYQGKLKAAEERAVSVRQQAEDKLDQ